ncbi:MULTISPECIES: CaiB/BaiF CoA-transferase family protein [unclassified Mesorhizobium]|uniref:CaiB/BaiF CoA transferase family protein n=1 Tax=unclassified Mesorhizobium TaxID=325217 RepID=UPI000FDAACEC|nr:MULTISPECIES: CaiB/BaiF CoA-transferase family protein [unclassified Mesorhizobium]TGQ11487.1 CoA transferase [Mesorhizobium sp. M2E.F.Ca.ET.219.01.1.1]TGT64327.1 CoA transferase [Mesorhizobium sp. M2E.F.Ca.ET.166.01.1.1]TGV97258.1 CoA transferase [Mesorhizobium sp. M2E.F.Ca.ET.154.01.1.1]
MLSGIKVVSFCHFLQGPAGAQYLADMGADVIKVEPIDGAHERRWSGADVYVDGVSGFYLCANRNKRSIGIDLKSPEGKEVARRLIAEADVVMENFRPGVFAKLGFDDQALRAINPTLIFASASGFGSTGPMALKPGQDLLAQARSGLMSVTGTPDRGPTPVGAAIVDQHGGALLAMGILGALVRRLRDGKGTRVEASLINSAIDLQGEPLVNYFAGGMSREVLKREKNLATWFHAAPYGVYPATDGHVVISLCDPSVLAEALGSDGLREVADVDRYADRDEYARRLALATAIFSVADLADRFDRHGIWWAPINYYDDLLADPQLSHAQVFRQVTVRGRTIYLVNHPNRYDGEVPALRCLALEIGEHTREILHELGYAEGEVKSLLASKAVVAASVVGAAVERKAS